MAAVSCGELQGVHSGATPLHLAADQGNVQVGFGRSLGTQLVLQNRSLLESLLPWWLIVAMVASRRHEDKNLISLILDCLMLL